MAFRFFIRTTVVAITDKIIHTVENDTRVEVGFCSYILCIAKKSILRCVVRRPAFVRGKVKLLVNCQNTRANEMKFMKYYLCL